MEMAGEYADSVRAAWDSVGVDEPTPVTVIVLSFGVTLSGQDGFFDEVQHYSLETAAGGKVTCVTEADNGDADLFIRFVNLADPWGANECSSISFTSNEVCTTATAAQEDTTTYVEIKAYLSYYDLSITCFTTSTTTTTSTSTTSTSTTTSTNTPPDGQCSGGESKFTLELTPDN